jgi:dTDP-glucose 4,6-dehydratase
VGDRPNHDRRYLINPAKIESALGFAPSIAFEEGIAQTVQWYVDHEPWWRAILERGTALSVDWDTATVVGMKSKTA